MSMLDKILDDVYPHRVIITVENYQDATIKHIKEWARENSLTVDVGFLLNIRAIVVRCLTEEDRVMIALRWSSNMVGDN